MKQQPCRKPGSHCHLGVNRRAHANIGKPLSVCPLFPVPDPHCTSSARRAREPVSSGYPTQWVPSASTSPQTRADLPGRQSHGEFFRFYVHKIERRLDLTLDRVTRPRPDDVSWPETGPVACGIFDNRFHNYSLGLPFRECAARRSKGDESDEDIPDSVGGLRQPVSIFRDCRILRLPCMPRQESTFVPAPALLYTFSGPERRLDSMY